MKCPRQVERGAGDRRGNAYSETGKGNLRSIAGKLLSLETNVGEMPIAVFFSFFFVMQCFWERITNGSDGSMRETVF